MPPAVGVKLCWLFLEVPEGWWLACLKASRLVLCVWFEPYIYCCYCIPLCMGVDISDCIGTIVLMDSCYLRSCSRRSITSYLSSSVCSCSMEFFFRSVFSLPSTIGD